MPSDADMEVEFFRWACFTVRLILTALALYFTVGPTWHLKTISEAPPHIAIVFALLTIAWRPTR